MAERPYGCAMMAGVKITITRFQVLEVEVPESLVAVDLSTNPGPGEKSIDDLMDAVISVADGQNVSWGPEQKTIKMQRNY